MSEAVLVLLEQAKHSRAGAERARRLAGTITTRDAIDELERYAAELERTASQLEERAGRLGETPTRTLFPDADIGLSVREARVRMAAMRPNQPRE